MTEERVKQLEWALDKTLKNTSLNPAFNLRDLLTEFGENETEWRIQRSGFKKDGSTWAIIVPYINARAIMKRLDTIVGPDAWQDEYKQLEGGILCGIGLKINGDWIWKQDGAAENENSEIDDVKTAISNAFKRAAVKWGVGRYLYDFETTFAEISLDRKDGFSFATVKDKKIGKEANIYWRAPHLPIR